MTSRKWIITALVIGLPLLILGSFISLALPITIIIEGTVVLVYAQIRKRDWQTFLTLVLIANLITQPILWIMLTSFSVENYWIVLLLSEVLIWILESLILYFPMRKTISFAESTALAFLLNLASFGLGLLFPI